MSIALLNLVLLWDGVKENKRTGNLAINISGRKSYFLLCAISEISVIAVVLNYIYPAASSAARLSQLWISLYAENKTMVIKNLQDTGNCCGLASLTDRAWPFENSRACHEIYKREASCLSSWLVSHNLTAVFITIIVSITLVFKGIIITMSISFRKTAKPVLGTHDKISNLDRELESGQYDLKAIKHYSTAGASKEAITFQNRNTFVNRFKTFVFWIYW